MPAPHGFSWQQTMLRIKDPAKSLAFYRDLLGFQLLHTYHFPQWKFSIYFLATLPEGVEPPPPDTPESERFIWTMPYQCIELTHNHGTETQDGQIYDSGNNEPRRGFGHIAIFTDDVYKACSAMEAKGVTFKKRPDDGRMKGLAFAYDPDGYWVEIIKRGEGVAVRSTAEADLGRPVLCQTMIRVKDCKASLDFYVGKLGMTLLRETHFPKEKGDFSLYFLGTLPDGGARTGQGTDHPPPDSEEARDWLKSWHGSVIELTHNHGTEDDPEFSYHDGNSDPVGFGHVGFLCDNLTAACDDLAAGGVPFHKKPLDGTMRGLAFALDPDGYRVEIIQRGLTVPAQAE